MHKTNFKFDPQDYQMICDRQNTTWKFDMSKISTFSTFSVGSIEPVSSGTVKSGSTYGFYTNTSIVNASSKFAPLVDTNTPSNEIPKAQVA